jgi:hypothetical protein
VFYFSDSFVSLSSQVTVVVMVVVDDCLTLKKLRNGRSTSSTISVSHNCKRLAVSLTFLSLSFSSVSFPLDVLYATVRVFSFR